MSQEPKISNLDLLDDDLTNFIKESINKYKDKLNDSKNKNETLNLQIKDLEDKNKRLQEDNRRLRDINYYDKHGNLINKIIEIITPFGYDNSKENIIEFLKLILYKFKDELNILKNKNIQTDRWLQDGIYYTNEEHFNLINKHKIEISRLKEILKQWEEGSNCLWENEGKNSKTCDYVVDVKEENKKLEKNIEVLKNKILRLEEDLKQTVINNDDRVIFYTIEEHDKLFAKHESKIVKLKKEIKEWIARHDQIRNEKSDLLTKNMHLEIKLQKNSHHQLQKDKTIINIIDLLNEYGYTEYLKNSVKIEIKQNKKIDIGITTFIKSLVSGYRKQILELKEKFKNKEIELECLRAGHENLHEDLKDLKNELQEHNINKSQDSYYNICTERDELEIENKDLKVEVHVLKQEDKNNRGVINNWTYLYEKLEKEWNVLKEDLHISQIEFSELQKTLCKYKLDDKQIENLIKERNDYKQRGEILCSQLGTIMVEFGRFKKCFDFKPSDFKD